MGSSHLSVYAKGFFGSGSQQSDRPQYCNSAAYKFGWFLDDIAGETIQDVGVGTVIAGGLITVTSAPTVIGAGAGAGTMAAGGVIYTSGTAASEVGNFVKWLSGQSDELSAAKLLSIPTMRLGPVAQLATERAISFVVDNNLSDPCQP